MLLAFVDWLIYGVCGFSEEIHWQAAVHFFIYDTIKIFVLLFVMISIIGVLRTFIPQKKMKQWLVGKHGLGNMLAACFGAVTPFCSCSSIPIFLGFLEAGIPLGVTFSFLITSPLINEYLVVLMIGFFGWKITVLYVLAGLSIGVISGIVLGGMKLERHLVRDIVKSDDEVGNSTTYPTFASRIHFGIDEAVSVVRKIWFWVIVGVGLGALIHNFVPQEQVQAIISATGPFSVPIATALGVPMYGSCAAIVPIAVVLFQKGIPLGTALAFMMATAALSLPEAIMLRRAMNLTLIATFFLITTIAIIVIGYLLNLLAPIL